MTIVDWTRASDVRIALAFGMLALVLRIAWVLSVTRRGYPLNDSFFYNIVAQQLAAGHGFTLLDGRPTAGWPPAYPFLLSIAYRVFGHGHTVGPLMNAVIGAATVSLLYLVARRTFGRREAVFAAAVLALFPTHIVISDVLMAENLDVFLIVALFALLTVCAPTRAGAAILGAVIGLAALTRGENLLLVAVPIAVWWPALTPRLRFARLAILLASMALVVSPWVIRNAERVDAAVISTNTGQTLYGAHNPHATGTTVIAPTSLIAQQLREPFPRQSVDINRTLTAYARNWAIHHPLQELLLIPKRFLFLIGDDGDVFVKWIIPDGTFRPTISPEGAFRLKLLTSIGWYALFTTFLLVLVLAGRSLWRMSGSRATVPIVRGALTWIAVTTVLYCVVFFGQWRYHFPLEPLMILTIAPVACATWAARQRLAARFQRGESAGTAG